MVPSEAEIAENREPAQPSCGWRSVCHESGQAFSHARGWFAEIGLIISALAVVASTHQVRSDYARLQALELQRWELQEQYPPVAGDQHLGGTPSD